MYNRDVVVYQKINMLDFFDNYQYCELNIINSQIFFVIYLYCNLSIINLQILFVIYLNHNLSIVNVWNFLLFFYTVIYR